MKKLIFTITFLFSFNIYSQNAEDRLGAWYMYGGSHKVSEKLSVKSLAHFRFFEVTDDLQQLLIRVAGNYSFNKTINVSLGYAYLNTDATYNLSNGDTNEHRIYEDFNIKHQLSSLKFTHRLRLEHRFFETNTNHWIRYQIGLNHSITSKWSTYFFNEIFLNLQGKSFAQNWIGGGLIYKVSKIIKLKAGYLNVQQTNIDFNRIQIGVIINTNHSKKK